MQPNPQAESNGGFTASQRCETCHEESYKVWKRSGHTAAFKVLAEAKPPRNYDPECLSCHVVGWDPQRFFPYRGGYESMEKTPQLTDVGCDACHGPGAKHIEAESGSNQSLQEKYRKAVRVTKEEAEKRLCISCHDGDNSPDFETLGFNALAVHGTLREEGVMRIES